MKKTIKKKKTDALGVKIGIGIATAIIMMLLIFPMARAAGVSLMDGIRDVAGGIFGNWLIDQAEEVNFEPSDLEPTFTALSGPELPYDHLCVSGVCTYYYSGEFLDATTTLFAIQNPLHPVSFTTGATTTKTIGATTTVSSFTVVITGVSTSTVDFKTGTSTLSSLNDTSNNISASLINTTVATNTLAFFSSGVKGGLSDGGTSVGEPGLTTMQLAPDEYLVALASTTLKNGTDSGGVIGDTNTFTGTYTVEIKAPRR